MRDEGLEIHDLALSKLAAGRLKDRIGYVTNLWSFRIGEPRASNLAQPVVACVG